MHEQPDAAGLLAIARVTLLNLLLPALPPQHHYAARMVANAMAIAARQGLAEAVLPDALALATRLRAAPPAPGTPEYAAMHDDLRRLTAARRAVSAPPRQP